MKIKKLVFNTVILLGLVIFSQAMMLFEGASWYKWADIAINSALLIQLLRILMMWRKD